MILSFGPAGTTSPLLALPSLLALLGYVVAALLDARRGWAVHAALFVGWAAHAVAIVIDIGGIGSTHAGARFGFAPALSATMWLVLTVYAVERHFVPLAGRVRHVLALLGAGAVLLAFVFPGEFLPHVSSSWAPLHWVLGIASYGLFGVAVVHATMLNRAEAQMRQGASTAGAGMPLLRLERLTFRFVGAGFVVLTAALALGAWYAHPWRWDHKTVFSLLGWVVFAALLTGRRVFGWRGPVATRWLYGGAALLLLAYVGSRFVLEVLLQRPLGG